MFSEHYSVSGVVWHVSVGLSNLITWFAIRGIGQQHAAAEEY